MIQVNHYNKQSSFGAGSSLFIYMQTEIADQQSYLPAAFVTNNPRGFKFRKAMHAHLHSTEIVQLLKKDELKVRLQGDTLFAGWTVPISLLPPKYVLPPGCLTIEGFGKVKTYISEVKGHMNRRDLIRVYILRCICNFYVSIFKVQWTWIRCGVT